MLAQPLHGHFLAALALAVCAACLFVFYAAQVRPTSRCGSSFVVLMLPRSPGACKSRRPEACAEAATEQVCMVPQDTSKHNAALLQIPGEGMEYNVGDRVLAGRRIAAPTNQLRYDTEVPYPEENGLGQPRNNHMSWMGTNVAWAGANGGGLGFARLRAPMLYGTETYPYWEEENTGFAEAMMDGAGLLAPPPPPPPPPSFLYPLLFSLRIPAPYRRGCGLALHRLALQQAPSSMPA